MTKIQLKRSSALLSGSAQAPTSSQLDYGELAINYNSSDPQLFFKDSTGSVVSLFDNYAALGGATFTGDVAFSADVDFDGAVTIKGDSTNGSGKLSLTCEQNTHTVNIKAPAHSSAANYTLTLPSSAGTSSQVLTTDGSGNLSWAVSSMSTADKNKLDGIETGAQVNTVTSVNGQTGAVTVSGSTDLSYTASTRVLASSTGNDATIPEVIAAGDSGLMTGADKTKLDGIETNATADQTAAEILSALLTVDGSGSGLDADLLDGIQASGFVQTTSSSSQFISSNSSGAINPNNTTINGLYYANSVSLFGQTDGALFSQAYNSSWQAQIFQDYRTGQIAIRGKNNGTWQAWRTVWDSSNDGAGSGLDADNLDGYTWDTSGKNIRGTDIYADDWFRNYNASEGLYNEATGKHFFSASSQYWHLNASNGLIFYDGYNASAGNATNRKGYVYWDSNGFGLLNSNGNWCVNIPPSGSYSNALIVGGYTSNNHYNSISSSRMSFGGGNDFGNYHLGTNSENYGGTYTKLDLRWHTGIRMGAQSTYGGIRLYNNEDLSSLQWQFNGNSGYTYKYVWLKTNTTGIYSDTNSAHIQPNTTSSYGAWRINGSRGNYAGLMILDDQGYHNTLMWNNGNGGWYQPNGSGWTLHWSRGNSCMAIAGSNTSSSYDLYVTGAIYATGNITAYSDARKKTNIKTIESALSKVLNLRGVTYNKINVDKTVSEKDEMGVIAQEVEKIVPEVVTYAEDVDEYGVSYGNLTALLIEAIKELKIELTELKESLA